MKPPSRRWKSQKVAFLDSLSNWLERRLALASIVYFSAFGLFLQWWLQANISGSASNSSIQALFMLISILLLFSLGPALLVFCLVLKQIQRRINH